MRTVFIIIKFLFLFKLFNLITVFFLEIIFDRVSVDCKSFTVLF